MLNKPIKSSNWSPPLHLRILQMLILRTHEGNSRQKEYRNPRTSCPPKYKPAAAMKAPVTRSWERLELRYPFQERQSEASL
uniref:Uncharacterized protein n=1 Tax=Kalanchoe fedtschenkoi TaxID=63787 RepID=A0A7N0SYW3_KALFE